MILANASSATLLLGMGAIGAYAIPTAFASRLSGTIARSLLWLAWLLHGALLSWNLLQAVPRFGFAPAVSVTAWLVLTVYAIERQHFPQMRARWALAGLGAAAVLLALVFPGQPLHTNASAWLPLHLALGIAAYGLFATAVVHASLLRRAEKRLRLAEDTHSGVPLLTLERITFRFVAAGFILLTATLIAGVFFSEVIYGRAFHWDHKAVFSVLSWLTFAALLLGRSRFGWRGKSAVSMLYVGAVLLLLAYVGSRFALEVILGRNL